MISGKTSTDNIHIGRLIKERLKEDGRTVTWLAGKIPCTRPHLYKIFNKSDIDCALLLRISIALDFDFFQYYSSIVATHISERTSKIKPP